MFGASPDIDPRDAAWECLQNAWRQWHAAMRKAEALSDGEIVVRSERQAMSAAGSVRELKGEHDWHHWVRLADRARDKVVEYAEKCARMGVEEREIRLAEVMGVELGSMMRAVATRLGLTPRQLELLPAAIEAELVGIEE